jgi:hypothetical protein
MDTVPPPHRILYEPLNDETTRAFVTSYTLAHAQEVEVDTIDAAVANSMDDFAKWVGQWMTFVPARAGTRCRLLVIWHAHFLSLACQQMLRRSLEQRSFRCRVWFHIEEPTLQAALLSRCIVTRMPGVTRTPRIIGPPLDRSMWEDPRALETDFQVPID